MSTDVEKTWLLFFSFESGQEPDTSRETTDLQKGLSNVVVPQ